MFFHSHSCLSPPRRRTEICKLDPLDPGHLIEQLHEQSMQSCLFFSSPSMYKFEEAGKCAFIIHDLERDFVVPPVEEKERDDEVQDIGSVIL